MKDALGDSGLLCDPDLTLCNSPEPDKSSQVQKIVNKIESKLFLSGDYNQQNYHQQNYQYQQQLSNQRSRPFAGSSSTSYTANKSRPNRGIDEVRAPNSRHIKIIKVDPTTFHKKVNKSVMLNHQRNIVVGGCNNATNTATANEFFGYNPFADENDNSNSFQLSKSANFTNQPGIRVFGNDMTNFLNSNQTVTSDKPKPNTSYQTNSFHQNFTQFSNQNFSTPKTVTYANNQSSDVYGKSIFRPDESGIYLQNSNMESSCSNVFSDESQEHLQSQSSNEITFKNYDLNDEYWLNFDQ